MEKAVLILDKKPRAVEVRRHAGCRQRHRGAHGQGALGMVVGQDPAGHCEVCFHV